MRTSFPLSARCGLGTHERHHAVLDSLAFPPNDIPVISSPFSKKSCLLFVSVALALGFLFGARYGPSRERVLTVRLTRDLTACGRVVSATGGTLKLREFDFTENAGIVTEYQVSPQADLGPADAITDFEPDQWVAVLYSEERNVRVASTIRSLQWHTPHTLGMEADDKFSFGKVVSVGAGSLTVREYDFARDADVDETYHVNFDTEYGNINALAELKAGDDVVLDYEMAGDSRLVMTLVKEEVVKDGESDAAFPDP